MGQLEFFLRGSSIEGAAINCRLDIQVDNQTRLASQVILWGPTSLVGRNRLHKKAAHCLQHMVVCGDKQYWLQKSKLIDRRNCYQVTFQGVKKVFNYFPLRFSNSIFHLQCGHGLHFLTIPITLIISLPLSGMDVL